MDHYVFWPVFDLTNSVQITPLVASTYYSAAKGVILPIAHYGQK
jgi:hypothetical protein